MFDSESFGKKMEEYRTKKGYSIYDFAIQLTMGFSNLGKIESGKIEPTACVAVKIANTMGTGIDSDNDKDLIIRNIQKNLSKVNDIHDLQFLIQLAYNLKFSREG